MTRDSDEMPLADEARAGGAGAGTGRSGGVRAGETTGRGAVTDDPVASTTRRSGGYRAVDEGGPTTGAQMSGAPMRSSAAGTVVNDIAIADPAPLGLAAFAATTFVLSVFNAKILKDPSMKLESVVLPLALFYGGLVQLLAGMWEFRKGNTFGATAFTSYGAFWLSYAALAKFVAPSLGTGADAGKAVGLYLLVWAIFTSYMFLASFRTNALLILVFGALAATFWVLAIAKMGGHANLGKVGGYLGIATAILAWLTSWAGVMNNTFKRTILPLGGLAPKRSRL